MHCRRKEYTTSLIKLEIETDSPTSAEKYTFGNHSVHSTSQKHWSPQTIAKIETPEKWPISTGFGERDGVTFFSYPILMVSKIAQKRCVRAYFKIAQKWCVRAHFEKWPIWPGIMERDEVTSIFNCFLGFPEWHKTGVPVYILESSRSWPGLGELDTVKKYFSRQNALWPSVKRLQFISIQTALNRYYETINCIYPAYLLAKFTFFEQENVLSVAGFNYVMTFEIWLLNGLRMPAHYQGITLYQNMSGFVKEFMVGSASFHANCKDDCDSGPAGEYFPVQFRFCKHNRSMLNFLCHRLCVHMYTLLKPSKLFTL